MNADHNPPPMPVAVDVALTVREDGTREGLPVVVLSMTDVIGDTRVVHLNAQVTLSLLADLAAAYRQLTQQPQETPWTR